MELFAARPYAEVCIEEIAEACEISKPTLYKYFESKQALAAKVAVEFHAELRERVTNVIYDQADAVEQALVYVD